MPEFVYSDGDLSQYLSSMLNYPSLAIKNKIEGKVYLRFVVTETGKVSEVEVVKGIGGGCDEEAVRVISKMPNWKPGRQAGKPVSVYFTLPIVFKLADDKG